jgi:hypothetical protein
MARGLCRAVAADGPAVELSPKYRLQSRRRALKGRDP